jgi:hypothetical protein
VGNGVAGWDIPGRAGVDEDPGIFPENLLTNDLRKNFIQFPEPDFFLKRKNRTGKIPDRNIVRREKIPITQSIVLIFYRLHLQFFFAGSGRKNCRIFMNNPGLFFKKTDPFPNAYEHSTQRFHNRGVQAFFINRSTPQSAQDKNNASPRFLS